MLMPLLKSTITKCVIFTPDFARRVKVRRGNLKESRGPENGLCMCVVYTGRHNNNRLSKALSAIQISQSFIH